MQKLKKHFNFDFYRFLDKKRVFCVFLGSLENLPKLTEKTKSSYFSTGIYRYLF